MVAFQQIVTAIIVLAVLGVAIAIPLNLLMGKDTNLVGIMLGLGGNISELDREIVEEFEYFSEEHKVASQSMLGLTYSINAMALADYHSKWSNIRISDEYKFEGEDTDIRVKAVPWGLKMLHLTAKDAENNADRAKLKLAMAIVECWNRYKDKEEDTNCYRLKVDEDFNAEIKEYDLKIWIDKKENIQKLKEEYIKLYPRMDEKETDSDYQKRVNKFVNLAKDLLGNSDFGGPVYGAWAPPQYIQLNSKEYYWIFKEDSDQTISSKSAQRIIMICGTDGGWGGREGIRITNDWLKNCISKEDEFYHKRASFVVENFELPQEIRPGHSFYNPVSWLETHGDPKYLAYYEVFPKGEDKQWEHFSWETFALGVGIAVVAEGFGYGIVKLASPTWKITKGIGNLLIKLPGVKIAKELSEKAIKEFLEKIGINIAKESVEGATEKLTHEGVEKLLKVWAKSAKYGSEISKELNEKIAIRARKIIIAWKANAKRWGGIKYMTQEGVITKEGIEQLNKVLTEDLVGKELFSELGDKAAKQFVGEYAEIIAKASKDAFDPKFLGKIFSARNGRKLLRDTFESAQETYSKTLKEGTEEAAQKAAREVLEESLDPTFKILEKLEPKELAKIMKKNKDAAKLVWKPGEGIDWAVFGGKPLTAMDDWSKIISKTMEGNKFTSSMLSGTASFVKDHKKDWVILVGSMIAADYIMSKQAKYINIGENAIGLKLPNEDVVIYGQRKGIWKPTLLTTEWNDDKEKFLEDYGKEGNTGLLPEAGAYYLQLEKDKLPWWPDQDPTRFFLASPCKADVYLTVDRCECYGNEPEDLEPPYDVTDFAEGRFGKGNEMIYKKVGEYDLPTKICNPNKWLDDDIGRSQYSPMCIRINPLIDQTYPNNFCYSGSHVWQEATQYILRGVQFADLMAIVVCQAFVGCGFGIGTGAMMAIAGSAEAAIRLIDRTKAWPDHGEGT